MTPFEFELPQERESQVTVIAPLTDANPWADQDNDNDIEDDGFEDSNEDNELSEEEEEVFEALVEMLEEALEEENSTADQNQFTDQDELNLEETQEEEINSSVFEPRRTLDI